MLFIVFLPALCDVTDQSFWLQFGGFNRTKKIRLKIKSSVFEKPQLSFLSHPRTRHHILVVCGGARISCSEARWIKQGTVLQMFSQTLMRTIFKWDFCVLLCSRSDNRVTFCLTGTLLEFTHTALLGELVKNRWRQQCDWLLNLKDPDVTSCTAPGTTES